MSSCPIHLISAPLTVEVELSDGSLSNKFPLSLHPKPVLADTEDGTHFADTLTVAFMQEEDCDIYYSINNSGEKQFTGAPVTIAETSHIYPYAKVIVDGVDYRSDVSDFFYYKCSPTEDLIDGTCVSEDSGVWVLEESVPYLSGTCTQVHITDFNPGSWHLSYLRENGESGILGYGTYTVPPSVLKPGEGEGPTLSASVTSTIDGLTQFTMIMALTYDGYPLDGNGELSTTFNNHRVWSNVVVEVQGSASAQGTLRLPKKVGDFDGWGEYVVLQTVGGGLDGYGCKMYYNNVYRWKE